LVLCLPFGAIAAALLGQLRTKLSGGNETAAGLRAGLLALALAAGAVIGVGGNYFLARYGPGSELAKTSPWVGVGLGIYACLATGFLCGLANGGLIVALRMHPFIITLGTMAIFRGIAFIAAEGQSIGFFPPQLQQAVKYEVGADLTLVPLAVMLAVTIVGWIYLTRLAAGRRVYAVGGNEVAAQYSGIEVPRVKLGAYLWSGATAGLAALMSIGFYGAGSSGDGQGYELSVIAAAVVGGASLTGGRGTALGAMLGALIIQEIATGIVFVGIDQNYSQIITGAVVVIAVTLDKFNTWLTQRRLSRKVA
jgi:ribose transport system permease protein